MKKTLIFFQYKPLLAFIFCLFLLGHTASGQKLKVLSNNILYSIDPVSPSRILDQIGISNIISGQELIGMDYRPSNGLLYALGYNNSTKTARLYTINTQSGKASAIIGSNISIDLQTPVAFDFNPTSERIRLIDAKQQSFILDPNNGGIAKSGLTVAYAATDSNAGKTAFIGSCAYTNSFTASSSTKLYGYDDSLNVFCSITIEANGNLTAHTLGGNTGFLKNLTDKTTDIDIYYHPIKKTNTAYFIANPGNASNDNLFLVDLKTGKASLIGGIGSGMPVQDLAIVIERKTPVVNGELIYGLTNNNDLLTFYSEDPSALVKFITMSGLLPNEQIVGMDFRPKDLALYGLGMKPGSDTAHLYKVNFTSSTWQLVNSNIIKVSADRINEDIIGFDFDPISQKARIVSGSKVNIVLNVDSVTVSSTDNGLHFPDPFQSVTVYTCAYTNSYSTPASTTSLYTLDQATTSLALCDTPQNGLLNTIGSLKLDTTGVVLLSSDMDIVYEPKLKKNLGFMTAFLSSDTTSRFFTIDMDNGTSQSKGSIGNGINVKDIAGELPIGIIDGIHSSANNLSMNVFPNPASQQVTLQIALKQSSTLSIQIVNTLGQVIATHQVEGHSGENTFQVSVQAIPAGIYQVLTSTAAEGLSVQKLSIY